MTYYDMESRPSQTNMWRTMALGAMAGAALGVVCVLGAGALGFSPATSLFHVQPLQRPLMTHQMHMAQGFMDHSHAHQHLAPMMPRRSLALKGSEDENLFKLGANFLGDLASFVTSETKDGSEFPDFAYEIGNEVYLDINGWHVFFNDVEMEGGVRLNSIIAQTLGKAIQGGTYDEQQVDDLFEKIPISVGNGKNTAPLSAFVPSHCIDDLKEICERADLD